MESIFAEGKVAVILLLVQLRDGDEILGGCSVGTRGKMGSWGNRAVCITEGDGNMYVGCCETDISGIDGMVGFEAPGNV